MRTLGIWVFGLIAFAIIGGVVWGVVNPNEGTELFGAVAGICVFACLRLWLAK